MAQLELWESENRKKSENRNWFKIWFHSSSQQVSQPGLDEYPLPDPTRTFFLLPEPDPNYFLKFPSLGFFSASCFPAGRFNSFNNNPQILLFFSRRYKKWIQGKSGKFDDWFMMHFDLIFQSRQSNPRFIHNEAIKSINQDGDKLLSDEAHAL